MNTMTVDEAKRALGLELDRELAEFFGAQPGSVFNWRERGTLPSGRIAVVRLHLLQNRNKKNGGRR